MSRVFLSNKYLFLLILVNIFVLTTSASVFYGAKKDKGTGNYYEYEDSGAKFGLKFDVISDMVLKSVKVYNGKASTGSYIGERTFTLLNYLGDTVSQKTVNVVDGEQRLIFNMDIPKGKGYLLISDSHKGLWRDNAGVHYPYVVGNVASIVAGAKYDGYEMDGYYFFYDWEVEACNVIANFDYDVNDKTVSFDNEALGAVNYLWTFGDGNTSNKENPIYTYKKEGAFTVSFTASDNDCSMQVSQTIMVGVVINSLSDYPFVGEGYGQLTTPSIPAPGVQLPYVPDLTKIKSSEVLYVAPDSIGSGLSEDDPASLTDLLIKGDEIKGKTIIALDGTYLLDRITITKLQNVNIIAKNKHKAKITGKGKQNMFFNAINGDIRDVSIIGFEAYGDSSVSSDNGFIKAVGSQVNKASYNIYMSDMIFRNYGVTLYSGLHSHDWTVDKSLHHTSSLSYLWYMMGWHQSVINTVFYNNSWYSLAVRGCYPMNETYYYYEHEKNILIKDRTKHFLADNDWTHLIANNTFGSNDQAPPVFGGNPRKSAKHHITIFYNIPYDEQDQHMSEEVYFPMKNVLIVNNAFVDEGRDHKRGVVLSADRGVNDPNKTNVASVNGLVVANNYSNRTALEPIGNETDISTIDLSTNHINIPVDSFGFVESTRTYEVSTTSILRNAATDNYWVSNADNIGTVRFENSDVGAYECIWATDVDMVNVDNSRVSVYPNPSEGIINIDVKNKVNNLNITIYNSYGQLVQKDSYRNTDKVMLNLYNISNGIYFISIENGNNLIETKRVSIIK